MDFDPKKDYYAILGVGETAPANEIKKSFRKLAVKHHPDKGGSKEKFQEINEAHAVLSDEKKRQQYDLYRKGGFSGFGNGAGYDFGNFGGFSGATIDMGDLGDLIWNMFTGFGGIGGGRGTQVVARGEDLKKIIEISFEESFLGTEKKISYIRLQRVAGVKEETCWECKGRGKVSQVAQTMFGAFQTQAVCSSCYGYGKMFTKDGKPLPNAGLEERKEILEIKIPAGIKDDAYLKYAGKGNAGIGDAPEGDLYLKIRVTPNSKYRRKEDDIYVQAEVSLFDLVLGGEIEVPHPEGKIEVKVPKGTQIGDKIKVGGRGFSTRGLFSSKGDLFIETQVNIPKKLSKEEEKLWKELQELGN